MTATDDWPQGTTWRRIVVVAGLVTAPLAKGLQVGFSWSIPAHATANRHLLVDGIRQAVIVVVLLVAALIVIDRRSWFRAVGLWPDGALPEPSSYSCLRWPLCLLAPVGAVIGTVPGLSTAVRWVIGSVSLALLLALVAIEAWRHHYWRPGLASQKEPPRLKSLWVAGPLTLVGVATTMGLAASGHHSHLQSGRLVELIVVTAAGEELIFRGLLLAMAYRVWSPITAQVFTALSFAAWHVGDVFATSHGAWGPMTVRVAATVVVTFTAGLVFTFLRRRTGSLVGSTFAHVATNLAGIVFAV